MPRFQRIGVHVERRGIDIDEHRRRAESAPPLPGRAKRKPTDRTPHPPRADALRHQHHSSAFGCRSHRSRHGWRRCTPQAPLERATSGPLMNWHGRAPGATASSTDLPSRRRCAARSMKGTGSGRRCWFMVPCNRLKGDICACVAFALNHGPRARYFGAINGESRLQLFPGRTLATTPPRPLAGGRAAAGLAGFPGSGSQFQGLPRLRRPVTAGTPPERTAPKERDQFGAQRLVMATGR